MYYRKYFLALLLAAFTTGSIAQDDAKFEVHELAQGLYMIQGVGGFTGGNIGLSVGEDGVILIDDSMPPFLDKLQAAIASITKQPIDFLINTHVHGDHTGNNEAFGTSGAHIVAHKNLRKRLREDGMAGPDGNKPTPKNALPVITFDRAISFYLNQYTAKVFHVENAHTDGDAVIYFKEANVIHTGDAFFNGLFPFIDSANGGSVSGFIAAQKKILSKANAETKIIPGHGSLATAADLKASIAMLEDSLKMVSKLKKAGKSEDQVVAANPLKKYHDKWNWGFITTEKMTRTLYQAK